MDKGILLSLSAPSGTGKSTLIKMLFREFPEFGFSVSYTTRPPRTGEVHGKEYFFVDHIQFQRLKDQGFFAEWAIVHGNHYGTPRQKVLDALKDGQSLVFDIDVQGAVKLKKSLDTGLYVFIFPPSLKVLQQRLEKRGTDDPDTVSTRLENAAGEIRQSALFDYWVVNHDLDQAFDSLRSIVKAERSRPEYNASLPETILNRGFVP